MGYHYRARYECILFFEKGKRKLNDLGIADILEAPRINGGYPAEKPPEVSEVLIAQSTEPGELVIDPFMGSGSVGVAAVAHGRDFRGNDLCAEAVDDHARRGCSRRARARRARCARALAAGLTPDRAARAARGGDPEGACEGARRAGGRRRPRAAMTGNQYRDLIASYIHHNYAPHGLVVYVEITLGKTIIGKDR